MKETTLWRAIKKNLPMVHWQRIESGGTAQGIPDLNGCYKGREVWIELKQGAYPVSRWQHNWIRRRTAAGGNVWVIRMLNPTLVCLWRPDACVDFVKPFPWDQILKLLFED